MTITKGITKSLASVEKAEIDVAYILHYIFVIGIFVTLTSFFSY